MGLGAWPEHLAEYMIVQHTTPCQVTNWSPAELLMGRCLWTVLDRLHPLYAPSKPLDSHSTIRPVGVGDSVYARNYGGSLLWIPRRVIDITGPCSYKIDMGQGRVWHRHQDQIRARRVPPTELSEQTDRGTDRELLGFGDTHSPDRHNEPCNPPPTSSRGAVREYSPRVQDDSSGLAHIDPVEEQSVESPRGRNVPVHPEHLPRVSPRRSGRLRHGPAYLEDYACTIPGERGVVF